MYSRRITPDAVNSLLTEQRVNELLAADRVNSLVNGVRVNELLNPDIVNSVVTPQRVNSLVSGERVNALLSGDSVNALITGERVDELIDLSGYLTGTRATMAYSGLASAVNMADQGVGLYFYRAIHSASGVHYHGTFHNSYVMGVGDMDGGSAVQFAYRDTGGTVNDLFIEAKSGYKIMLLARFG